MGFVAKQDHFYSNDVSGSLITLTFFQRDKTMGKSNESQNHTPQSNTSVTDVATLQKEIMDLQSKSQASSEAQIVSLKEEVAALKSQLKTKDDHPIDTNLVKLLLKNNIRYAEEKNNEQLMAMKAAIETINVTELENQTKGEMSLLKEELAKLKKQIQEREDDDRTRVEINNLKADVAQQLKVAEGKTKGELSKMMDSVESMANKTDYQQTKEELERVKNELAMVKQELKETEKASKVRLELVTLKKSLEMELWNSQGMNKKEIKAIKSTIRKMDKKNIDDKTFDELSVIRRDVKALKEEIKTKEESTTVREELSQLRTKVTELLAASEGKSRDEILGIKSTIDSISARQTFLTDKDDVEKVRAELDQLRQQMADKKEAVKMKDELATIKASLQSEIIETKQKNREAFDAIRDTFANFKAAESHVHDSALEALTSEVKKLKDEVEEQNRANHELEKLQRQLTEKLELLDSDDEDNHDLLAVKNAVDAVAAFDADEDSEAMLDDLTSLKSSIKEAEASVHSAKDLELVKFALEKKLQSSDGKSKMQIEEILSVVEHIDLRSLGDNPTHSALKTELGATKRALKSRELYGALSKLEVVFKETRPAMNRAMATRYRREIDQIKSDAQISSQPLHEIEESINKVQVMHDEIEMKSASKKEKKGLRKFLSNLVGRVKTKSSTSHSVASITESTSTMNKVRSQVDESINTLQRDGELHANCAIDTDERDDKLHENCATDVDDFIVEEKGASPCCSAGPRLSLARSKHSHKSKQPETSAIEDPLPEENQVMEKEEDPELRSQDGPPAEVSVKLSATGSVVSRLSKQFGDMASVTSFSSMNVKKANSEKEEREVVPFGLGEVNQEKDNNDSQSVSSKRSKRSMRSAASHKSIKPVSSQKSSGGSITMKEHAQKTTLVSGEANEKKKKPAPTSGMPPLYPSKSSRATRPSNIVDDEEEEENIDEHDENDPPPHDDEFLDGRSIISVAMVHHNEQGEFDIETIVEPNHNTDMVVPLTMSI